MSEPKKQFPPAGNLVDAPTLARWLAVSERMVAEMARKGIVVRAGRGRFQLEESVRRVIEHMRDAIRRQGGADVAAAGAAERARLAKERADGLALENAHRRGALLDSAAVEREWTGVLSGVRARMLAVPSRCAGRLPHLLPSDVAAIDGEVRDALVEAVNGLA